MTIETGKLGKIKTRKKLTYLAFFTIFFTFLNVTRQVS